MPPHPKEHSGFITRLREITGARMTDAQFGVNELAREMGMSRSNLHRRVKSATGGSVSRFISRVRLEKARDLLRETTSTISDIAFETGFHSVTYFTKCFRDHFGYPPGEVRNQDRKDPGMEEQVLEMQGSVDSEEFLLKDKGILEWRKRISPAYLISAILIVLIAAVYWIIFRSSDSREMILDKSIAVLPFINDTPEESEMYFINGTMEAILSNLSKIEDLRVVSRTTVEQYRNHPQPIPVIGKELGVSYILEGSGQKYGKKMHLTVQLLDATNDKPIWSEEYDREINQIEDLFELQNAIAMMVVTEIHAEVSPEELKRMGKIPTTSEVAYEFYLKGSEELGKYWAGDGNAELLKSAETLFRYALEYDPAFAAPYHRLARIYYTRLILTPSTNDYRDSIEINAERALHCDPEDADSYEFLGVYHRFLGDWDKAIENFNLALQYNPSSRDVYADLGWLYAEQNDFVNSLENLYKSLSSPQPMEPHNNVTETFLMIYLWAGFKEQFNHFAKIRLEYSGDTARYFCDLAIAEYWIDNNLPGALDLLEKSYRMDSTDLQTIKNLGEVYLDDGQYARSLEYFKKYEVRLNELKRVDLYSNHVIGLAYWLNGDKESAEHFLDLQETYCREVLAGSPDTQGTLASIYALRGDRERAYRHLEEFNKQPRMRIYVKNGFKEDNLFHTFLKDDPEYKEIRSEILSKYEAEHERVMRWLEEQDIE